MYCQATGQRINTDKSSIHFAKGVSVNVREEVMAVLEVHNEELSEKYLGMPTDVGTSSNGAFKYLKDRVWNKVQGWMEQSLSAGGKEVLIKVVAQAVPTFLMSCFRLPRGLCQHIDSLLRGFWWGSKEGKRKTCWVEWDDMTKPKYMGDFLAAELGPSPSRVWRAVLDGKEVLKQGLIRRIGTGEDTDIWRMNWIPRDGMMRPVSGLSNTPPATVDELINPVLMSWDLEAVKQHFLPMDWELMTTRRQQDFWAWHYEKSGVFSVRLAYRILVETRERRTDWIEHNAGRSDVKADQKEWTELWSIKVPSKVRVFLWRLARQSIPTGDVRLCRNMTTHYNCTICGRPDSWRHSLLECNMAKKWLHEAIKTLRHEDLVRLVVTLWAIWYTRRRVIHEDIFQSPLSTHHFVENFLNDLTLEKPKGVSNREVQPPAAKWIPSPQGMMKINVDATLSKNSNIAAVAAVARDE
ncbi:Unknown protein [Striga hermonthica]|uniref:Reverse transcriptase zinc-binding domain-containing protein n=1 Tax=Striga hermonthica TaxID=68872 RepID=A0A9N7NFY2_STRHE|nr:Unknown protein [Striga hermonthica]